MMKGHDSNVQIDTDKVQMKREMGLVSATSVVIGSVIGAGIFITPKGVLQNTGSIGLCLLVWLLAGVSALGSALCYSELGTTIQKSGGGYTYIKKGLGNHMAFVYALQAVVRGPGSLVVMLLTFAKYMVVIFPTCGRPLLLEKLIAVTALFSLVIINTYSSRLASRVTVITTIGKTSALVVIIIGGIVSLCQGVTSELGTGFSGSSDDPTSIALALYSAIFATGGGANLNSIVEEIRNPGKNLPRAAIFGILLVIVVYILTNVSYLAVMTKSELLSADAVAFVFGERVLGSYATLIPLAVMVSTFGSANNNILSGTRVTFSAARDGNLPDFFSYIHVHHLTPLGAMTVTTAVALIYIAPAEVGQLISFLGFVMAFFNGCIYFSLIRFRLQTMKDVKRIIKIPLVIPILMVLLNLYLFIAPLVIKPRLEYVYVATGLFGGSLVLYVHFIYRRWSLPGYDKFVTWFQLVFQVCPPAQFME
ncbi:unnamed protein product [Lymnaea stagnalis]|uniref:Amino acid transporter n=1 Tax=Lymnaea stagnalis TaxID=6523 RepID=A0AAV2ID61_LYMST